MATGQPTPQTPRAQQVRRVERRINDDWQYIQPEEVSDYATISESFIAEHNKRAMRPTTLRDKQEMHQPQQEQGSAFTESDDFAPQPKQVIHKKKKKDEVSTAEKLLARTRASANNISIMVWGTTLWLSIQIPFGLISLAMFGFSGALHAIAGSGGLAAAALWLADAASSVIGGLFGFDSSIFSMAESLFLATYVLVLAVGIFSLLAAYLQYTLSLVHPLSGEKSGLKWGVFMLAFFGYSVPLLNLFPWILVWMAVVWKYPR